MFRTTATAVMARVVAVVAAVAAAKKGKTSVYRLVNRAHLLVKNFYRNTSTFFYIKVG
jgi:hypothetical protein